MNELREAVEDLRAEPQRRLRVRRALYLASKTGTAQKDLVEESGYKREHVRRLIEDERIECGEIAPTKRYLEAQARKNAHNDA